MCTDTEDSNCDPRMLRGADKPGGQALISGRSPATTRTSKEKGPRVNAVLKTLQRGLLAYCFGGVLVCGLGAGVAGLGVVAGLTGLGAVPPAVVGAGTPDCTL